MTAGIYALTIRLTRAAEITFGGAAHRFPAGWYVYAGSAMGGLEARVARHLRTKTVRHWHVDGLLAAGAVEDVQVEPTKRKRDECRLAREVARWPGAETVPGFGASDCACGSHLAHFRRRPGASILARRIGPHLDGMIALLRAAHPGAIPEPDDPFRTLAGCILSLRTQDPVTDAASRRLFARWPDAPALAAADPGEIAPVIYPVGMYRAKSRTLVTLARQVIERHGGHTPSDIDALVALPGVGRKTANLVRSFAFRRPAVCVDTHVHRITNRWGLVRTRTPDETEQELRRLVPERHWIDLNPLLVRHGQTICRPVRPRCDRCPLAGTCRYDIVYRGD